VSITFADGNKTLKCCHHFFILIYVLPFACTSNPDEYLPDPHPDPLVTSADPAPDPDPDPSIIKKNSKKHLDLYCFVISL
jgi:hypothetical protein